MTTAAATAIGAPQAHASTSPSRVDRASRNGSFLAIIAVAATNTSAVVAKADRPKVRYSITSSLGVPFRGLMCCDPTHNLIAAELCVRRPARCATEFSERLGEFRVQPSTLPRVYTAQTLYCNALRLSLW